MDKKKRTKVIAPTRGKRVPGQSSRLKGIKD